MGGYKLTIYSNTKVDLVKLNDENNAVQIGKWENSIDGGIYLQDEPHKKKRSRKVWSLNPNFELQFKDKTIFAKFVIN